ncbi:MAG: hypothetical protein COT84_08450 [Chlamydiae bacterium CG10_big_fil_rev_8_21_14_0_10_35_9]|nr:MAG: hypothetical protein COT84_08450 [Chlamydiae bacterium CG10_big_fil_rev_8_21_14_0_10_35_9]
MAAVNNPAQANVEFDWDNAPEINAHAEVVDFVRRVETVAKDAVSSAVSTTKAVAEHSAHVAADATSPQAVASAAKVGTDAILGFVAQVVEDGTHQQITRAANATVNVIQDISEIERAVNQGMEQRGNALENN